MPVTHPDPATERSPAMDFCSLALKMIFLFFLTGCACFDCFTARVPGKAVLLLYIGGLGLAFSLSCETMLLSLILAGFVFGTSYVCRTMIQRFIGGADISIICIIILCLGPARAFSVLSVAFLSAGAVSLAIKALNIVAKKLNSESRHKNRLEFICQGGIPFVPFILLGAVVYLSTGV